MVVQGSKGKSLRKRSTQATVSEVAKQYDKIKGENEWVISLWVRILKYIPG